MSSVAEVVPEMTPDTRSIIYLGMDIHKESMHERGYARDLIAPKSSSDALACQLPGSGEALHR